MSKLATTPELVVESEDGWSRDGQGGSPIWALAPVATLAVKGAALEQNDTSLEYAQVNLTIALRCYLPRQRPFRELVIVVGEFVALRHLFATNKVEVLTLSVPFELIAGSGGKIELRTEDVGSPYGNGESPDRRKLGVQLLSANAAILAQRSDDLGRFIHWGAMYLATGPMAHLAHHPWANSPSLLGVLKRAIADRKPFSMIRLGDGEGRFLGFPVYFSPDQVCSQGLRYQFGKEAVEEIKRRNLEHGIELAALEIRNMIVEAMHDADVIGVPAPVHLKLDEQTPGPLMTAKLAFLAAGLCAESDIRRLGPAKVFDTYVFRPFARAGMFDELLTGLPYLGIVCHTDITPLISGRFKIKDAVHVKIPGHAAFSASRCATHYPDGYKEVMAAIRVPSPGAVFLVGAGYLGKAYCRKIKALGGVAIDVGSIFDSWIGSGRTEAVADSRLYEDLRSDPKRPIE